MRILIVCSGNSGNISPFIKEQTDALGALGVVLDYCLIQGKGGVGYLKNLSVLNEKIKTFKPDLIHAHYGLSGLLANFQRKIPVVTTFHGSDIWVFRKNLFLSRIAHYLSAYSIVVDSKMVSKLGNKGRVAVIPCAVDINMFKQIDIEKEGSKYANLTDGFKVNILFSSRFDYYEKNYSLAKAAMSLLGNDYNLIELRGYSRDEVNHLLNVCDLALMTSLSEGSPQFIKEAMSCNRPIVSTDVGDVRSVLGETKGCYICSFDPSDVVEKVRQGVAFSLSQGHTNGRQRIVDLGLDGETIARRVLFVYESIVD